MKITAGSLENMYFNMHPTEIMADAFYRDYFLYKLQGLFFVFLNRYIILLYKINDTSLRQKKKEINV